MQMPGGHLLAAGLDGGNSLRGTAPVIESGHRPNRIEAKGLSFLIGDEYRTRTHLIATVRRTVAATSSKTGRYFNFAKQNAVESGHRHQTPMYR